MDEHERAQAAASGEFAQKFAQLESLVKPYMTPEALTRYGNLRVIHGELCIQAMVHLAKLVQAGKITKVDDKTFKLLLLRLQESKKETNITFR